MLKTFLFKKDQTLEENVSRADMLAALGKKDCLLWVDLEDPSEFEAETLVEIFNFHPLAVEDCISDKSNPKVDDYEDYLFLVTHAFHLTPDEELATHELNVFLGKNYVVTYHKNPIRGVEQVRALVQKKAALHMGRGADMLFHCLLDHLVDSFMPMLDRYDKEIDDLEEHIFNNPPPDYLSTLLQVKHDMFTMRRIVAPQRDTLHFIIRNSQDFIRKENEMYFRDIYDHLFRVYSMAEGFHDSLSSILQVYFSYSSNKLNDVMRRMTLMATLTMPAVVIASIYGMNFEKMPALHSPHGFLISIGLMAVTAISMLVWMKLKKWI